MKLTWEGRLFLLNTASQTLFFIFTFMTLYVGLGTTLPFLFHDDPDTIFKCKLLILIILINVVANFICIKLSSKDSIFSKQKSIIRLPDDHPSRQNPPNPDDPSRNGYVPDHTNGSSGSTLRWLGGPNGAKSNTPQNMIGWTECDLCNEFIPQRAKHCPLCSACVLKRDHHCFFAGCCIGFHNQRYFIMFCMYGAMGAIYSSLATYAYLQSNYEGVQNWGVLAYFLPFVFWFWINGTTSGSTAFLVLFLYWTTFASFMCLYFFILQVVLVYRGQTRYECKKRLFSFSSTLMKNYKSVFGPSRLSLISFVIPLPFIGYFGDGKSWEELNWEGKIA